jgi:hypothetical protein
MRRFFCLALFFLVLTAALPLAAQAPAVPVRIEAAKGVDSRVDYASLVQIGPWDDRNYLLTRDDLAVLPPGEREQLDPIPAFFRVELRRQNPGMPRTGEAQYPRSALQIFFLRHGGFLVDGLLYQRAIRRDGAFVVLKEQQPRSLAEWEAFALTSDVRVTSPNGGAESAIKINPLDSNKVIGGANGPGSGQKMFYSTNGGTTWTSSAALPLGSTCCDPAVDWSSDGTKAYTATLGGCGSLCNVWVYRSADGGATWNDLETVTPGDPRRELTSANTSDKEYIHVDKFGTSPRRDNVYICWHDNNTLKFSRSTDFGNTWSAALTMSSGATQSGIGCDIVTDKSGNVYYFWPATDGKTILSRKSTDGGASFAAAVTVANTQDGYDFAIPAMETRRAFIYASADADLSSGTFANRVYVAWTDTTAAENTTTPSSNHARIQVAWSDNGTTWTVRTPHETADASTVDRFHPWIGVSPNGTVHVMFYDTRQNSARTSVDMYYSKSTDGGNTWSAPVRATSATSPHIEDSFQWGDYNGLDADATGAIGIFTDNRNESSGSTDSVDVYAAASPAGGGCTPPAAPTGVTATSASSSQINVSWTASAGATSYNVLRSTTSGGPYTQVGTSATTSFSNTGLTCNTTYYYVVQAVSSCASGNSAQASATTGICTGSQLLGNPGFETGTAAPWVATSGVINNSTSQPARTGTWKAWLDGYGSSHTDSVYQDVTIPSTATSATLTFWLHIDTAETTTTTAFDTLKPQVRNTSNTVLATLATYSNLDKNTGYAQKSFNLIAYKGQTIRIYFLGVEDSSLQTSFVIDDTALNVQ